MNLDYGNIPDPLMPSARKKQIVQATRKRQRRGRIYLVIVLIIIIAGVGLYVYASSLPPGPPDFAVAAPTGVTVYAGTLTTTIVNVTAINRFAGIVRLSATGSTGLTASISPENVTGSGIATLTLTAANNGTYTLAVTGTSGSLTHSVSPRVATPVYATLVTSNGTIVVALFQAQAPRTVANFVTLASSGFYTNLVWHRIVPGFVIQTGDPTTVNGTGDRTKWGQGGSPNTVPLEIDSSLHNDFGYLGMARSDDPNSGSSQFYINLANNRNLDGNYTVFGKVLGNGMDVANKIANVQIYTQTNQPNRLLWNQPIQLVYLESVTIS